MAELISRYFKVKCLGIDVMAGDISKPWMDGNFGIIELKAGPGVFMHLSPAEGDSIDVPGLIMDSHFYKPEFSRIPIIAGNNLTFSFVKLLLNKLKQIKPTIYVGSLSEEGVYFNENYFCNNESHDQNVKLILRNPEVNFALFNHSKYDIYDYGFFHQGADVVVIENPNYVEESIKEQILDDGILVEVVENDINVIQNNKTLQCITMKVNETKDEAILSVLQPYLEVLINRYE